VAGTVIRTALHTLPPQPGWLAGQYWLTCWPVLTDLLASIDSLHPPPDKALGVPARLESRKALN
jgi:hypothetical protein